MGWPHLRPGDEFVRCGCARHGVCLRPDWPSQAISHCRIAAQIAVRNQGYIPYSDAPINYRSQDLSDPVTLLQKQSEEGKVSLTYEPDFGYLRAVLNLLKVPTDSQTLVFSKTSFQYPKISPPTSARALLH